MNKEQILDQVKKMISNEQMRIKANAPKCELIYLMGYNDGVLDLCDALINIIEEAGEDE